MGFISSLPSTSAQCSVNLKMRLLERVGDEVQVRSGRNTAFSEIGE